MHMTISMKIACAALMLASGLFAVSGAVRAEPPHKLTPGEMLHGLVGGAISALTEPAPIKVQRACAAETGKCWEAHGITRETMNQVFDACWREAKHCPQACKDEYFSRRKAGMTGPKADPLFHGRNGEETSCVPGMDALTHPERKKNAAQPAASGQ